MSKANWVLNRTVQEIVADEVETPVQTVGRVIDLFKDGCEVAYIARYRNDVHGGMTCEQLRRSMEVYTETVKLNDAVGKAVISVEKKVADPKELKFLQERLKECVDTVEVKEIVKAYQTTRKTKATVARELGMGEVSDRILNGESIDLKPLINTKQPGLETLDGVQEQLRTCLADAIHRMPDTQDQLLKIASLSGSTGSSYVCCHLSNKAKKLTQDDEASKDLKQFENYVKFKRRTNGVENFQILAMERGEERGILTWGLEIENPEYIHPFNNKMGQKIVPGHRKIVHESFQLSVKKQFVPKIERHLKRLLLNRAHLAAIECFAKNIGQLFSQESLKAAAVIALDPGFSACKAALLTGNGDYRDSCDLYLEGKFFKNDSIRKLMGWVEQAGSSVVIAIGNGKASFETQTAVAYLIKRRSFGTATVKFCVVSECGASKYSITPLAEQEFPELKPNHRSAVSIGRRLLDPMAEYVKIEPQHLGMGMYQHSVNEKKLATALEQVVREKVSLRGVDVNKASLQLLQHVCGLNRKTAEGVLALKEKNGRISSRDQIKSVAGIGPKSFEQCAGFLIVNEEDIEKSEGPAKKKKKTDYNPLDRTCVHPSQYDTAQKLLKLANVDASDIGSVEGNRKLYAFKDSSKLPDSESEIVNLMIIKIPSVPPPSLLDDVRQMTSLKKGEIVTGRVQNQCDFGLFVDIGVGQNALAHKSKLRGPVPEVGSEIQVLIDNVDVERKRIGIIPC